MGHRSPTRWLAPLALLGSVAAVMAVVASPGSTSEPPAPPGITGSTATQDDGATETTTTTAPAARGRRFYRVREGDTLTVIADRTGVALAEIELLNPDVDAQTLRAGQRIKLRP